MELGEVRYTVNINIVNLYSQPIKFNKIVTTGGKKKKKSPKL